MHAWFAGFDKLRIRFERRLDIQHVLLALAAAVTYSHLVDDLRCPLVRKSPAFNQALIWCYKLVPDAYRIYVWKIGRFSKEYIWICNAHHVHFCAQI